MQGNAFLLLFSTTLALALVFVCSQTFPSKWRQNYAKNGSKILLNYCREKQNFSLNWFYFSKNFKI